MAAIYISAIRHEVKVGRLRNKIWVPTEHMLANLGTKLEEDGTVPLGDANKVIATAEYHIKVMFKWSGKEIKPQG